MFSLYSRSRLHSFGEIVQPWRFWWMTPLDGYSRLGLRGAQPALRALAAQARRRRLQRLVHVPDPARGARGDRAVAAAVHQVGRRRVRPARQGGRLPDGDLPRRGGLARAVDRQERRARLAGLLPPAQPLRRGAAALAVPARRPDGPREPQPPDQAPGLDAVLHRRAAPPGARGRAAPGPDALHATCRPSSARSTRSASSSPTPSSRPTPTPSRRSAARSRRARASDGIEIPGRLAQLVTAGLAPIRQLRPTARARPRSSPRSRSARWTPSGTAWRATTPRSCR